MGWESIKTYSQSGGEPSVLAYLADGGGKCCHWNVNLACADESEKKIYCVPTPNI